MSGRWSSCLIVIALWVLGGGAAAEPMPEPPEGAALPAWPAPDDAPAPEPPQAPAAQDGGVRVLRVSLRDAARMALEANLTLRAASFDAPIAHQETLAAQASFDTLLTASFTVARVETPSTSAFFGTDVIADDALQSQVGVTRLLRTGGSVSVLYRADRLDTTNAFQAAVNPSWSQGLSVEATQPLLRGAGDVAIADIRRAQNGMLAARAGYAVQLEATLLAVVELYWELVYAGANLDARRKSEEVAAELLADAQSRLSAEMGTPLEVADARAGLELRRSERLLAENLRGSTQDQLLSLIMPFGQAPRDDVHIEPVDGIDLVPTRPDVGEGDQRFVRLALQGRPDLRASRAELANRGIDIQVAYDAIRPQLDLMGSLGGAGLDRSFGASTEDVVTGRAVSASLGLQFSLFLGQRAARARWRAAAWARRQALLRHKDLENLVVVEVRAALRDMATARAQRAAADAEVAAAKEALEGEQHRLSQGRSTPFRILQKEEGLTGARTRLGRAGADLRKAEGRLWKAVGILAENLQISTSPWRGPGSGR